MMNVLLEKILILTLTCCYHSFPAVIKFGENNFENRSFFVRELHIKEHEFIHHSRTCNWIDACFFFYSTGKAKRVNGIARLKLLPIQHLSPSTSWTLSQSTFSKSKPKICSAIQSQVWSHIRRSPIENVSFWIV